MAETTKPCIICVAITGSVPTKKDNPAVPTTVEDAVAAAVTLHERNRTTRVLAGAPLMHGTSGIVSLQVLSCGGGSDCNRGGLWYGHIGTHDGISDLIGQRG